MTRLRILLAEAHGGERRAASLDRLAVDLDREATALVGHLDGVLRAFGDGVWRGPAAVRARGELLAARRRARSAADELRAAATLLRRRAGELRSQSAELRRRADPVTGAMAHPV